MTGISPELAEGRLAGRRIVVTGAASGIGRATAQRFAEEGAAVALLDRDDPSGAAADLHGGAVAFRVDLLDRAGVQAAVGSAADALGGIDGVVNCAGVSGGKPLADLDPEWWDWVMGVNLTAPYLVCRAALPHLRQAPGCATIVNIASGMGLLPTAPGMTAYAASKGGLISFTKALAFELAPDIRANAVIPGVVDTPMTSSTVLKDFADPNDAPFVRQYALNRVAEPKELAEVILFLTSRESSYVTGIAMAADGGRTFH